MRRRETLLTIIQTFCRRTGIPVPTTAYNSSDAQVAQAVSLLEELCEDLIMEHDWQFLTRRTVFDRQATVAERRVRLEFVADAFFSRMLGDSPVNISKTRRLTTIPTTALQATWEPLPIDRYSIEQDNLLLHDAVSGDDISILWITRAHVLSAVWALSGEDGVTPPTRAVIGPEKLLANIADTGTAQLTPQPNFHNANAAFYVGNFDGDQAVSLFPADLLLAGLRFRWKEEKGLAGPLDAARYQAVKMAAKLADIPGEVIDTSGPCHRGRESHRQVFVGTLGNPPEDPLPEGNVVWMRILMDLGAEVAQSAFLSEIRLYSDAVEVPLSAVYISSGANAVGEGGSAYTSFPALIDDDLDVNISIGEAGDDSGFNTVVLVLQLTTPGNVTGLRLYGPDTGSNLKAFSMEYCTQLPEDIPSAVWQPASWSSEILFDTFPQPTFVSGSSPLYPIYLGPAT